ncbi:MAG: hypothetical protein AB8G22_19490 [Saprospiraceae bacterium]
MTQQTNTLQKAQVRSMHIAYHAPPRGFVGSLRNGHIIKELDKFNQEQIVLTARFKDGMPLELLSNTNTTIYQLINLDYRLFSRLLPKRQRTSTANYSNAPKSAWSRKLMDSFPTNLLFGEGGFLYVVCGIILGIYLIKKQGITHLFSYYRCHADLLIAAALKRCFPQLKWIADFADTPIDPAINNVFFKAFQQRCYQKLLRPAEFITTVSKSHGQLLRAFHPRVHLLYNGIEKLATNTPKTTTNANQYFTITYTGSLYGKRDPRPLFAALQNMIADKMLLIRDLRLVYAGKDHQQWDSYIKQFKLTEAAITHQHLSPTAARQLQQDSQINLLLSWANPQVNGWLTYKLYEYLLANRPILSIVTGSTDAELEAVIGRFNSGLVYYPQQYDELCLRQFITYQYEQWQLNGQTKNTTSLRGLERYEWRQQVARLWTRVAQQQVLKEVSN